MQIVRVEFGSHLYGTNTEKSDHDFKSVYVPKAKDILLQRVVESTGHKVVRPEGEKNSPEDTDDESYSLQKYLSLLAQGQTVAIDMLFVPKPLFTTPIWEHIKENKDKLLTKKSASFVGYCRTQANKYGIKGSRVAAAKEAKEGFERWIRIHGPTAKVFEVLSDEPRTLDEHTRVLSKETTLGKFETYFECCDRKVGFKNTLKEALAIYTRIYEEYGHRARLAQSNEGIDWKALSHAVRVGTEAVELLYTGKVTFPLPNKEHVLEIKLGKIPYAQVAGEIEYLLYAVEKAEKDSILRDEPDYEFIDDLVYNVYRSEVLREGNL